MRMHPAVWFVAGIASVYAYHKFVKPIPSSASAA